MPKFAALRGAGAQIRATGASLNEYLWSRKRRSSWNLMVISDHLSPSRVDPFQSGKKARMDSRRVREVLRYKNDFLVRHGKPNLQKLASFLRAFLSKRQHSVALAVTYNENATKLHPEPWDAFLVGDRRARFRKSVWHKGKLDLRRGARRPVICLLPEDCDFVCGLAVEFWRMYGRNFYLFLPDGTRIVVCHERDLHVCTRNRAVMRWVRQSVNRFGLSIAPIEIQQCV